MRNRAACTQRHCVQVWSLVLPSFSHQAPAHLMSNMVMLLYVGKRIHQLLGRWKFLALYATAAAAGSVATELGYRLGLVGSADAAHRYHNVLMGSPPDEQASLGASDSVLGMLAFWYAAFPRTKIHLFRGSALLQQWLTPSPAKLASMGMLRRAALRLLAIPSAFQVSALWLLPAYFMVDAVFLAKKARANAAGRPSDVESSTNHAAHLGGFLAGIGFYAVFGRRIKRVWAPHLLFERDPRRWYLMAVSLAAYTTAVSVTMDASHPASVVSIVPRADQPSGTVAPVARANDGAPSDAPAPHPAMRVQFPSVNLLAVERKDLPGAWRAALNADADTPAEDGEASAAKAKQDKATAASSKQEIGPDGREAVQRLVGLLEAAVSCANKATLTDTAAKFSTQLKAQGWQPGATTIGDNLELPVVPADEVPAPPPVGACDADFLRVRDAVHKLTPGLEGIAARHAVTMTLAGSLSRKPLKPQQVVEELAKEKLLFKTRAGELTSGEGAPRSPP